MTGVLEGFSIIWVVIAVGYLVGRTGVLGEQARYVLNRVTFFVASPALLFTTLADSDPSPCSARCSGWQACPRCSPPSSTIWPPPAGSSALPRNGSSRPWPPPR